MSSATLLSIAASAPTSSGTPLTCAVHSAPANRAAADGDDADAGGERAHRATEIRFRNLVPRDCARDPRPLQKPGFQETDVKMCGVQVMAAIAVNATDLGDTATNNRYGGFPLRAMRPCSKLAASVEKLLTTIRTDLR